MDNAMKIPRTAAALTARRRNATKRRVTNAAITWQRELREGQEQGLIGADDAHNLIEHMESILRSLKG